MRTNQLFVTERRQSLRLSIFRMVALLTPFACGMTAQRATAQIGLGAFAGVYVGNLATDGSIPGYYYAESGSSGAPVSVSSTTQSWQGMDSSGNPQTESFTGQASAAASYGALHAAGSGQLTNPYFNMNNPAFYDGSSPTPNPAGSPQYFGAYGSASFNDTITILSTPVPAASIEFNFHVDGSIQDPNHDYAVLGFNAGTNGNSFFTSNTSADWSTGLWTVDATQPIPISADFQATFSVNVNGYAVEGQDLNGFADYSDTLTVTGFELFDANGNPITGATYSSGSGTAYSLFGGSYVPEPGSICLGGAFVTAILFGARRSRASVRRS